MHMYRVVPITKIGNWSNEVTTV